MNIEYLIPETNFEYLYIKKYMDILYNKYKIDYDFYIMQTWRLEDYNKYATKKAIFIISGDEKMNASIDGSKSFAVFKHYENFNNYSNIFPIPLGYNRVFINSPIIPIEEREIDIFFIGQKCCQNRTDLEKIKSYLIQNNKDKKILIEFTDFFMKGRSSEEYSKLLHNSKFALCPYGTNRETYRFYEAMKTGSIIISYGLPNYYFYNNAPVHFINDWKNTDKIIKSYNVSEMKNMSNKVTNYWENNFSENAIADYIFNTIKKIENN